MIPKWKLVMYGSVAFLLIAFIQFVYLSNRHMSSHIRKTQKRDDLRIIDQTNQNSTSDRYSKFRCVGDDNDEGGALSRICLFFNICYNKLDKQWTFYQKTLERPVLYEKSKGILTQFEPGFVSLTYMDKHYWHPKVKIGPVPVEASRLTNLHSLFRHWPSQYGLNMGHFVWEDLGGVYNGMRAIGIEPEEMRASTIMDLEYDQNKNDKIFQKFHQLSCAITDIALQSFHDYVNSHPTQDVCFNKLQVGGNFGIFQRANEINNAGKEVSFKEFRDGIVKCQGLDPGFIPKKHLIVITNKKRSNFGRSIKNLDEMTQYIKNTYPLIPVEVVEWDLLPFREQILKAQQATVLITPAGGVSMILPFMSEGTHAIIMDFHVTQQQFGFNVGDSGSMESAFWGHLGWFKKNYYQVKSKEDYVFDTQDATDARWFASVVVKMDRIKSLIDFALEDMSA